MIDLTQPEYLYRLARSGSEPDREELALAMQEVLHEQAHPVAGEILLLLLKEAEHELRVLLANKLAAERNCPLELIQFLVYQTPLSVAEPVLRLSPLLDDTELLKILDYFASDPGYVHAIAQRQTISAQVAAKVLEQGDENAQLFLLKNQNAELNEICLDYLVDIAKKRPACNSLSYSAVRLRRPLPPNFIGSSRSNCGSIFSIIFRWMPVAWIRSSNR